LGEHINRVDQQREIKARYINPAIGLQILDMLHEERTILEIETNPDILTLHQRKARGYQKTSDMLVALMINFGVEPIQFHREVNNIELSKGVLSRTSL
jgi:GxxExxY protein